MKQRSLGIISENDFQEFALFYDSKLFIRIYNLGLKPMETHQHQVILTA